MKFLSIHLSNYIGIYNGMGLYDINIDFTKCRYRMIIIRGDNGSGKSTLSKAMNLFPDPSESFIPGMPARKEITLADGPTIYSIRFIHGVKSNGDREVTKAYIAKSTADGSIVELNENGNVTSYKDILYSEFGLDANFIALSQLSTEDRGLADKKPAERKRFVNSIISSLDLYNNIYKTLNKRSTNYRAMINSVIGKLNVLGDEASISSNLNALEYRINNLCDEKDKAFTDLAKAQSTIQILDPDGSIQNINTVVSADLDLAEKEYKGIQSVIDSLMQSLKIKDCDVSAGLKSVVAQKNNLIIEVQILRNKVENLLNQKEQQANELTQKCIRLSQLTSGDNYDDIVSGLEDCNSKINAILNQFATIGIQNLDAISKDEYILAIETLKDLEESISVYKSNVDYSEIENVVKYYINTGSLPDIIDISRYYAEQSQVNASLEAATSERSQIQSKLSILDNLSMRPSNCTISECPFIKESIEFSNSNPMDRVRKLDEDIEQYMLIIKKINDSIVNASKFNESINRFSIILREVNKNASILSKMPNGDMFKNKTIFLDRLLSGYGFEYMRELYKYIDYANLFDTYKTLIEIKNKYESELKVYESKSDILIDLQNEIEFINKAVSEIIDQIEPIRAEIDDKENKIAILRDMEATYTTIMDNIEKQRPIKEKIQECRRVLTENSRKINDINVSLSLIANRKNTINQISYTLDPLMKERDKLLHSVELIKDYQKDLAELQSNYDFIEKLKYYSSPTTGIQLVFMDLYMGKIIALANDLLKFLFNGKFEIQPFVINDSEFRIPCLGDGYLNDDISSMSSSQISMISMILSFALLHHSSTKYNIIKLDEIDGPLDYNNRLYFMDVLNNIMNIMNTEQCIMISHNSELQVDNSDVILLRHDESNMDYQRGNVIWSY